MKKIIPTALLGVAGLTTVGLISMSAPAIGADEALKRDDDSVEMVLVAADDDDDTNDDALDTSGVGDTSTGVSNTNDATASNTTGVSRDRDLSRDDLTRDLTNDGPGTLTRDTTGNLTNDNSRNDTRG